MSKDKSHYCTVGEWIEMLSKVDPKKQVRVHTSTRSDLYLLSGYVGDNQQFFEIDVGDEGE